jgi:DnaK suppressor protein
MHQEHHGSHGPHWRDILETRWRERLQEVTELSLAYHDAAAGTTGGRESSRARRILSLATAARRRLADTDEALGRLATGSFGRCEQCGTLIPAGLLADTPESRYCRVCMTQPALARQHATAGQG